MLLYKETTANDLIPDGRPPLKTDYNHEINFFIVFIIIEVLSVILAATV